MKIKTNLRAGAKSGTAPSGANDPATADTSGGRSSTPVVVVTRCAGL